MLIRLQRVSKHNYIKEIKGFTEEIRQIRKTYPIKIKWQAANNKPKQLLHLDDFSINKASVDQSQNEGDQRNKTKWNKVTQNQKTQEGIKRCPNQKANEGTESSRPGNGSDRGRPIDVPVFHGITLGYRL